MKGAVFLCFIFAAVLVSTNANANANTNANQDGFITVNNRGGYVAYIIVDYTLDGKKEHGQSGDFTLGSSKTIRLPAGAMDVQIKAMCYWFLLPSTVFTRNYPHPVQKCFNIGGTYANPTYEEIKC